jgi:hypothetical protein
MDDIDVWRAADILIREHGLEATKIAGKRAHVLMLEHDVDGFASKGNRSFEG